MCQLVDVNRLPPFTSKLPPGGCCNHRDAAVPVADVEDEPCMCANFSELARSHSWQYRSDEFEPIRICDPRSRYVRRRHTCERVKDWLPRPTPNWTSDAVLALRPSESCPAYQDLLRTKASARHAAWDDPGCGDGCSVRPCGGADFTPCCVKRRAVFLSSAEGMWDVRTQNPWRLGCAGKTVVDEHQRRVGPRLLWRLADRAAACKRVASGRLGRLR